MRIANSELTVEIAPLGAELQSIVSADGSQWLWHGNAQWWTGRAPLLFPVVGRSPDNAVSIDGQRYPMQSHGFARGSVFEVVQARAERATLTLRASEATRQSFPFEFFLTVTHELNDASLVTTAEVGNLDKRD